MIYGDITPVTGQVKVVALKMQEKVVSPSTSTQKIMADEDYDGLISVVVEGMELQEKTVAPSVDEQNITFDYLYDGLSSVTIEGMDLQEKTISPTLNEQIITPDADYDGLSKVTIGAMPSATQASPAITVSSSGLITATSTQSEGYVAAGTKSATQQLTTQSAKTITPSTSSQTAVASGRYTTGAVTVAAIPSSYTSPTLLWTNASPTSSFDAQTINLNGSGYSAYMVEYRASNSDSSVGIAYLKLSPSLQVTASANRVALTDTGYGVTYYRCFMAGRLVNSCTNSSINFGLGWSGHIGVGTNNSVDSTATHIGIPTRIWGVKWSL